MNTSGAHGLDAKEAKAISILSEAAARFRNPGPMHSIGKSPPVLLHLALEAFCPGRPVGRDANASTGKKKTEGHV